MENSLERLLSRAHDGDEAAWNEIVDRFTNLLWSVCRSFRLSDHQAIDVVQTTWMRLLENLAKIHDPERLAGWLATTARRECLHVLRRNEREDVGWSDLTVSVAVDSANPEDLTTELSMLDNERDIELWRCFSRLSEPCQRLLRVLMAADPPAYSAVSEALGIPIGSIGPTRQRCVSRLRTLAKEAGYEFASSGGSRA